MTNTINVDVLQIFLTVTQTFTWFSGVYYAQKNDVKRSNKHNIYTCQWLSLDEPFKTNWLYSPMKVNWSRDVSLSDVTDKQTSWLVNVTFDWRQVMTTTIQRYGRTRCLITFPRRVFCTINIESSQLIKIWFFFLTFIGWWSQWLSLKFY